MSIQVIKSENILNIITSIQQLEKTSTSNTIHVHRHPVIHINNHYSSILSTSSIGSVSDPLSSKSIISSSVLSPASTYLGAGFCRPLVRRSVESDDTRDFFDGAAFLAGPVRFLEVGEVGDFGERGFFGWTLALGLRGFGFRVAYC